MQCRRICHAPLVFSVYVRALGDTSDEWHIRRYNEDCTKFTRTTFRSPVMTEKPGGIPLIGNRRVHNGIPGL